MTLILTLPRDVIRLLRLLLYYEWLVWIQGICSPGRLALVWVGNRPPKRESTDSPGELPSARRAAPPPPQGMCNKLQVICHHTQPCTNRQMHASATTRAAFGRECAMRPIEHTRLQTAWMMTGASRCTPFDHWLTCTRQEGMGHPLHIKVEYATLIRAYDRVLRVLCLRTR